jgi:signal peptidase I
MENVSPADPVETPDPVLADAKPKNEWVDLGSFLLKLVLIVFVLRSFIFSPFSIPSESMLPRLLIGDYLFVSKFSYGFSRHSLPFSLPLLPNMHWSDPTRGDVVVFKAPGQNGADWIKRVIGLPGDTIQMREGQVILNGKLIPKERIADFTLLNSPNFPAATPDNQNPSHGCKMQFQKVDEKGRPICQIPRFRETLPGGRTYEVLDEGMRPQDDTEVYTVPAGHVFLMGDNRDNSADSRFAAASENASEGERESAGISYVPMENIEGKAQVSFWSTDGSASWFLPWTWFTAARWSRIGGGF